VDDIADAKEHEELKRLPTLTRHRVWDWKKGRMLGVLEMAKETEQILKSRSRHSSMTYPFSAGGNFTKTMTTKHQ
jgi:hypothetical protein